MADNPADQKSSISQWPHAAIVAAIAVIAVAIVGAAAIYHYDKASDAVTVLAPLTGVISSLVAAYFGLRAGSLAQQKANESKP